MDRDDEIPPLVDVAYDEAEGMSQRENDHIERTFWSSSQHRDVAWRKWSQVCGLS